MTLSTLRQLYNNHEGKVSDKWALYLDAYDEIFSRYHLERLRLLEIGIQNGGSLEIWSKYFSNAEILIGCDIDEACRALHYEDARIQVIVGDANTDVTQTKIRRLSAQLNIIVDDGSHRSGDIVSNFARYFPQLCDDGLYVAEDLHCSYWKNFQGGLFNPHSSISFFKRLADIINFEHWGVVGERQDVLRTFSKAYGSAFSEADLDRIYSVEFRNSLCIIRKKPTAQVTLGVRVVVGKTENISKHELRLNGLLSSEIEMTDQATNEWSNLQLLPESELAGLKTENRGLQSELQSAKVQLQELDARKLEEQGQRQAEAQKHQKALTALQIRKDQLEGELSATQARHTALLASRSWRMASALQRTAARFPRISRWGLHSARVVQLLATFQFKRAYRALKQHFRVRRDTAILSNSRLFDADFYLSRYPDVASFSGGPLRHYVLRGASEARDPHPLFDARLFLANHPHLAFQRINPLVHYLQNRHLNPNPFFDGQWYLDAYPDVERSRVNPLVHYYVFGSSEGRDPSPRFATRWYLEQNPELAASGINPLEHFLARGQSEGRSPTPEAYAAREGASVMRAEIHCLKPPIASTEATLFVAHSPDGKLKPHVRHYLESLRESGISVTLIVAADAPFEATPDLLSGLSGLFVRRNEGYDFAAWAHVLRLRPDLLDADLLLLLNDSLIGPFNQKDFDTLLARVRGSSADLIGMTANHERTGWHLQSYFLALKKKALASVAFQTFFDQVTTLDDKDAVINRYELRLAPHLRSAGLKCVALFPAEGRSNPTIYEWRSLIQKGFPFVKVMVLRDSFENVDVSDWREVLSARGYDTAIADRTLEEARRVAPVGAAGLPLSDLRRSPVERPPVRPRVALIAPWNFDNGLGVASRSYISALRRSNFLINLHPIKRPFHVHRQIAPPVDLCDFSGDADVALIQLNPDGWASMFTEAQQGVIERARLRIGLWVWETPTVPGNWLKAMKEVDAIWAPSQYCADAFSAAVDVPVHVVPYVVPARAAATSSWALQAVRQALGTSGNEKIILYAFDGSSYLVRKNPFALLHAFGKTRLHERGWTLVLKTKHVFDSPTQGNALSELVNRTPGAVILNRSLDKDAMHALMSAASIYASPHCAEGFGLTVAEAMAMGKLVVATNYSGTCDFMDANSGFPVRYEMRTLEDDHGAYGSGSMWASVDEAAFAETLLAAARMVDSGDKTKGEAAQQQIRQQLSPDAVAVRMEESLRQLLPQDMFAFSPPRALQS